MYVLNKAKMSFENNGECVTQFPRVLSRALNSYLRIGIEMLNHMFPTLLTDEIHIMKTFPVSWHLTE